jgi:hypothetical protein
VSNLQVDEKKLSEMTATYSTWDGYQ